MWVYIKEVSRNIVVTSQHFAALQVSVSGLEGYNMIFAIFLLVAVASAQQVSNIRDYRDYRLSPYYDESPKPYAFSYNAPLEDGVGQSSRTETADGTGKVEGSYSLTNEEGHTRVVDYIADQDGFRATIRTNEPGTDNKNPANVLMESASPFAYAPIQYNPVLRNPVLRNPVLDRVPEVTPVQPLEVVPDNVIAPVPRPVYRRPGLYANRNYQYRPTYRNPYSRYA